MNCCSNSFENQVSLNSDILILPIPSRLPGLREVKLKHFEESSPSGPIILKAEVKDTSSFLCPRCQIKMHFNQWLECSLKHTPFGSNHIVLHIQRKQYRCPECGHARSQTIPCKVPGKMITTELYQRVIDLLKRIL